MIAGKALCEVGERLRGPPSRRPRVKSVQEADGRVALGNLRELLRGEVGISAQVLKALVGDVVVEARKVEGKTWPEMVARFTINAIPALAVLDRRDRDESAIRRSAHAS